MEVTYTVDFFGATFTAGCKKYLIRKHWASHQYPLFLEIIGAFITGFPSAFVLQSLARVKLAIPSAHYALYEWILDE
jgi:hypothetical protein